MEIIKLHHPLSSDFNQSEKLVLAMGYFDGIHLGHQKVLEKARDIAIKKDLPLAVLTYDHKPAVVYKQLSPHDRRNIIMPDSKNEMFESLGVNKVFVINYSFSFQNQTPQEFVDNYLVKFNADTVVAGMDHTYGAKNATMALLPNYAKDRFDVVVVDLADYQLEKISSTRIRKNLDEGHIQTVNHLMGRPFQTRGTVVHGFARGRELGYPTANIEHDELQWLPTIGVYVVDVFIGNQKYHGMASIGRNVTFGDKNPITVEINILDFNDNIYGEVLKVDWLYRIRGEVKFEGIDKLIKQLQSDEDFTRHYFENK
ncbi:riboflavin biosynthesis protein RibF [Apilactobacillus kunkeei]|uniref:riboflavin biosynthesis protein RibF n=1 Tax=Apilactobacillus kunkeei TaxID=148814 RepID=UPI00110D0502|nr:riboflavin biosynthesis protein RibF [Apilactobacillus kunkeei]TMS99242.1 riboflavin biosynthesis protein RibF [Apilactobacillus kunkeei]